MSHTRPLAADQQSDANLIALCTTMCPVQVMLQCRESAHNCGSLMGGGLHAREQGSPDQPSAGPCVFR